jgi:hypothetical protein
MQDLKNKQYYIPIVKITDGDIWTYIIYQYFLKIIIMLN